MNEVEQNFKSKRYYSSITGLDFHPRENINVPAPKYKKGDLVSYFVLLSLKKYGQRKIYDTKMEKIWLLVSKIGKKGYKFF
jgi:hypothetical protein